MASLAGADCNGDPGLGKDLMVMKASAKGGGGGTDAHRGCLGE